MGGVMHKNSMFILGFVLLALVGYAQGGQLAGVLDKELSKSLWDTKLIDDSIQSISNMPVQAVEELSNVLGSCLPIKGGQLREYFCERAKIEFQVKFRVPHSVNSVISALIAASDVMIHQSKFTSEEQKKYILELYQKRDEVIDKIGLVVNQRLAATH